MVLPGELGYAHDYYSKNGYGHKDDYYGNGYCENSSSSMQMGRPHITIPEPAKHFVLGHDAYGYENKMYGKQQNYHDDHGYPGGKHHGDGMYGKPGHQGLIYGKQCHGYPNYNKPPSSFGMHPSATDLEYESQHGYMHNGSGGYESMSYDYHAEERDNCPPYYEQLRMHNKNWAAPKAVEWASKGI